MTSVLANHNSPTDSKNAIGARNHTSVKANGKSLKRYLFYFFRIFIFRIYVYSLLIFLSLFLFFFCSLILFLFLSYSHSFLALSIFFQIKIFSQIFFSFFLFFTLSRNVSTIFLFPSPLLLSKAQIKSVFMLQFNDGPPRDYMNAHLHPSEGLSVCLGQVVKTNCCLRLWSQPLYNSSLGTCRKIECLLNNSFKRQK